MTLISGIRCGEGFVICADSQETVDAFRVPRKKLVSKRCGQFDLAIAGAGESGKLIDALVQRVLDNVAATILTDIAALKEFIQHEIQEFNDKEAREYSKSDREMDFLIGARLIDLGGCVLWKTVATRLTEVEQFALVGNDDYKYEYAMKNHYREDITIAQGLFLGLYIMWLAEQTSNFVKSPISAVVLRDNIMTPQPDKLMDELLQRVKLFTAQFENLFLACPDTGLQPGKFVERVKEFVSSIAYLRKEYVEEWVGHAVEEGLQQIYEAPNLIPLGTTIVVNPTDSQSAAMQRTTDAMVVALRGQEDGKQDMDRIISNLNAMKLGCEKTYLQLTQGQEGPSAEEIQNAVHADAEIMAAGMMGPYKVGQDVCNVLNRVHWFMVTDLGLGEHINLQLRMVAIDQTLQYLLRAPELRTPDVATQAM